MDQGKWISTKERLPKEGDSIIVSFQLKDTRQYWVLEKAGPNMSGGKLYFGFRECDYWRPLELIGERTMETLKRYRITYTTIDGYQAYCTVLGVTEQDAVSTAKKVFMSINCIDKVEELNELG